MLEARGLDGETAGTHGVAARDRAPMVIGWIGIPYIRDGRGRESQVPHDRGREAVLPGRRHDEAEVLELDVLRDSSAAEDLPVIITEGEIDALIALQCGFARVMSVPDGAPAEAIGETCRKREIQLRCRCAGSSSSKLPEIILATDSDGPAST
jgi:twinkle protein